MKKMNDTLTGLRGWLAISVVIFHIYGSSILEGYLKEYPRDHWSYLINYAGPISVNLFFIISGYLITRTLLQHGTVGRFALNRILRIYPVFLLIHLIVFAAGPWIGYKWMEDISVLNYITHFLSNLLLLPGVFPLPIAQIVAWSLSYEMAFYLLAGLVFVIYRRVSMPVLVKAILLGALLLVSGVLIYYHPNMLFFIVGIASYFTESFLRRAYPYRRAFCLNGIIWFGLLYISYSYNVQRAYILIPLLISYLFFQSILLQRGFMSRLLQLRPMQYLGKISYSLYMWHTMVMFPLKKIMPKLGAVLPYPGLVFIVYALLSLVLSIAVSHISYHIIELRLTNYLKRRFTKSSLDSPATRSTSLISIRHGDT
ncbi:acyltransferase family protein [Paenibacillus bouchesdurhonensis]|uniref:acyltransferase family protein n=1 Tax=Paenibacillus bouchesdurhonensis TaxID=1870990 RepID=UPI000DA6369D|nr:acyltransferase [Paenibacillus bouchesdurhonensis]